MRSFVLLALSGCTASAIPSCVPIVTYTSDFEKATALELAALPPGSHVARMVADYGRERAELRACPKPGG